MFSSLRQKHASIERIEPPALTISTSSSASQPLEDSRFNTPLRRYAIQFMREVENGDNALDTGIRMLTTAIVGAPKHLQPYTQTDPLSKVLGVVTGSLALASGLIVESGRLSFAILKTGIEFLTPSISSRK
jgi:hypothetical protein